MATGKKKGTSVAGKRQRPAIDPDAREKQMCSMAIDLAEKQIREGTASSQIITHYLKLAASTTRLEKEVLELEKELKAAKTENLRSQKRADEMFEKAIEAMGIYRGNPKD